MFENHSNNNYIDNHDTSAEKVKVVDNKIEDSKAQAYLDHLLNDGCNVGEEEADLQKELQLPPWYDEQLFKRGQSYIGKYRFVIVSGMMCGLIAVLSIPSILKVLICTRQSSTVASAYKRYIRTIYHTLAWYNYPMEPGSKFWKSILTVRRSHASSSKFCMKAKAGQITQKDLALTQFGFMGFITLGAHRISLYDDDFLESTSHMWRVIGYLMGIKDEYNLCAETWAKTKPRLEIVMRKVYRPALENADENFYKMSDALIQGLSPIYKAFTIGSYMFFTKRLAYCRGYEYFDFDFKDKTSDPNQRRYYYDLGWWDRFIVSYGLYKVTFLHKYTIFRIYLNLHAWIVLTLLYFWQYIPFQKFSLKRHLQ